MTFPQRLQQSAAGLLQRVTGGLLGGRWSVSQGLPVNLGDYGVGGRANGHPARIQSVDQALVWVAVALLLWGMVMVYSASIAMPDNPRFSRYSHTHFLFRHVISMVAGCIMALLVFQVRMETWEKAARPLFVFSLVLLAVVLIPFIGKGVNGARRWISLGVMNFQPSELAKLATIMYAADYMVRKMDVKEKFFKRGAAHGRGRGVVGMLLAGRAGHGCVHGDRHHRHGHFVFGRRQCPHVLLDHCV
jgi:cell division protein FtsW